jgi:RNA polymerase-binding transcription factor DksA
VDNSSSLSDKSAVIQFFRKRSPKGTGERRLFVELDTNLAGDWLNDPCTLDGAFNRAQYAITTITADPKLKYLKDLTVERSYDPPAVNLYGTAPSTGEKELICGFVPIPKQDPAPVRYSDQDLAEFEISTREMMEKFQADLKILQDAYADKDPDELESHTIGHEILIGKFQAALSRIQDKTFGICTETGQLIRKDALLAYPILTTTGSNQQNAQEIIQDPQTGQKHQHKSSGWPGFDHYSKKVQSISKAGSQKIGPKND